MTQLFLILLAQSFKEKTYKVLKDSNFTGKLKQKMLRNDKKVSGVFRTPTREASLDLSREGMA
jgi:hypothetical protein